MGEVNLRYACPPKMPVADLDPSLFKILTSNADHETKVNAGATSCQQISSDGLHLIQFPLDLVYGLLELLVFPPLELAKDTFGHLDGNAEAVHPLGLIAFEHPDVVGHLSPKRL